MESGVRRIISWGLRQLLHLTMVSLPKGPHLTRYSMYRQLSSIPLKSNQDSQVLSISGSKRLCEILSLQHARITEANYPDYNWLSLDFPDQEFDFVVCDQVLEHVEGNPQQAVDEAYRVLKPGGMAVITSCLLYPAHKDPGDYWRFTPEGLKLLCRRFAKLVDVGGWGNLYIWLIDGLGLRFVDIPHCRWHPLNKLATLNHEQWPIMTWIVAVK